MIKWLLMRNHMNKRSTWNKLQRWLKHFHPQVHYWTQRVNVKYRYNPLSVAWVSETCRKLWVSTLHGGRADSSSAVSLVGWPASSRAPTNNRRSVVCLKNFADNSSYIFYWPFLFERCSYISNGFIDGIHHCRVTSPVFVFYKVVFIQVFLWRLDWVMDILKRHVQKQRLGGIMLWDNSLSFLKCIKNFTVTVWILANWLVQEYDQWSGQWEYRAWKWRELQRHERARV